MYKFKVLQDRIHRVIFPPLSGLLHQGNHGCPSTIDNLLHLPLVTIFTLLLVVNQLAYCSLASAMFSSQSLSSDVKDRGKAGLSLPTIKRLHATTYQPSETMRRGVIGTIHA